MTVPIDPYVLDTLMADLVGHDRQPSAYLVYLHLLRQAQLANKPAIPRALLDIAEGTGLSKRTVQSALTWLVQRKLIAVTRASATAVPVYRPQRPWRRSE